MCPLSQLRPALQGDQTPPTSEQLYRKANLLAHAMDGVLLLAEGGTPALSWEDKLLPVHELAVELGVTARDLYVHDTPEAREIDEIVPPVEMPAPSITQPR